MMKKLLFILAFLAFGLNIIAQDDPPKFSYRTIDSGDWFFGKDPPADTNTIWQWYDDAPDGDGNDTLGWIRAPYPPDPTALSIADGTPPLNIWVRSGHTVALPLSEFGQDSLAFYSYLTVEDGAVLSVSVVVGETNIHLEKHGKDDVWWNGPFYGTLDIQGTFNAFNPSGTSEVNVDLADSTAIIVSGNGKFYLVNPAP